MVLPARGAWATTWGRTSTAARAAAVPAARVPVARAERAAGAAVALVARVPVARAQEGRAGLARVDRAALARVGRAAPRAAPRVQTHAWKLAAASWPLRIRATDGHWPALSCSARWSWFGGHEGAGPARVLT